MRAPDPPERYKVPPPVHPVRWFDYIAVVALVVVLGCFLFGMWTIVFGDPVSGITLIRK